MFEPLDTGRGFAMSRALKGVAIAGAGLLLSAGLCGLSGYLFPREEFGGLMGTVAFFIFLASAVVMLGSIVMLLVAAIGSRFRK